MKFRKVLVEVYSPLQYHDDSRGCITDIFYNENINHVAHISSFADTQRGNHYHKETTQHILVIEGTMEYWFRDVSIPQAAAQKVVVSLFDMITTPPYEIHALKFLTDVHFIVFSSGKRGGKDYESDTYRVDNIIED